MSNEQPKKTETVDKLESKYPSLTKWLPSAKRAIPIAALATLLTGCVVSGPVCKCGQNQPLQTTLVSALAKTSGVDPNAPWPKGPDPNAPWAKGADPNAPWPKPVPRVGPGTIGSQTLYNLLLANGFPADRTFVQGDDYMLPSKKWITGTFSDAFEDLKWNLGFVYTDGSNDCREFGGLAIGYARWHHNKKNPGTTLAIGEFDYVKDGVAGHEIVATVGAENGKLVVRFFEPQKAMSEVKLTEEEIKSCLFCRF
jgi:hypothetical protein